MGTFESASFRLLIATLLAGCGIFANIVSLIATGIVSMPLVTLMGVAGVLATAGWVLWPRLGEDTEHGRPSCDPAATSA